MNPTTEPPLSQQIPPPLPQLHRLSTSCDKHPEEQFTGFCPSCLCERLAVLDQNSSTATASSSSTSRKPPLAAAALKAIFKPSSSGSNNTNSNNAASSNSRSKPGFFPELRRTQSFSASKNEGFSGVFEPQRRSCDVRGRNTLWFLFNQDNERLPYKEAKAAAAAAAAGGGCAGAGEIEVETRNLVGSSSTAVQPPVFESKEEDKLESESEYEDDHFEISNEPSVAVTNIIEERVQEIVEEEEEEEEEEVEPEHVREVELKPMKDHIDLDSQTKKPPGRDLKEIAGSFWSAASVFSKKLQKWRQKQKLKKRTNGGGSTTLPVEKPIGRQYRETQSEIADYGFGRRSCDTDPRFSLDAGRISFDDPRYSFDEPRASWDGYMIGRTFQRMPTMLSVVEDAPPPVQVLRSDAQIPVEEPRNSTTEDDTLPGGSAQTRDYYLDSSSRRRKSLDRSNSIRKTAAAVVAEIDELKSASNSKVSPATADSFSGPKLAVPDLRDSNSNSLRDDCSESFDMGFRDNASVIGNGDRKGSSKKSSRWSKAWNIWGFINRRNVNKDDDEDRFSRPNGVERSFSESWQELRGDRNGDVRGGFNPKVMRSNSSVSWRNSTSFAGSFAQKKNSGESNGNVKKKREEFVLERNRSARYSPNNIDNGLLRFYLTPMRSAWRGGGGGGGGGKNRPSHAQSIARSVLRLY